MRKGFLVPALVCLSLFLPLLTQAYPLVPDPQLTPGFLCDVHDPDYAEDRYREKIPYCRRNVSSATKKDIYRVYGIPSRCTKRYTIDHFVPLSLGGDNSVQNLWPEHRNVKATRQNLEQKLYVQISKGQITQDEAVDSIYQHKLNPPRPVSGSDECDRLDPQANWDLL
ncbi:MAG: hypothetical protein KF767_05635 [Bdellovibrionaceae bacterium]|nr:hypothetical protein [Pseudobdellovibrionaceae bacterium]